MTVAIAGAQALILQLSAKYQRPKRRRNGITIAAAIASCERIIAGILLCPKTTAATRIAYTSRRMPQRRGALLVEQMFLRTLVVLPVPAFVPVAPVFPFMDVVAGIVGGAGGVGFCVVGVVGFLTFVGVDGVEGFEGFEGVGTGFEMTGPETIGP